MLVFSSMDVATFLTEYWQKKPVVIRQGLPDLTPLLSPNELAGLAMDEEVESRIVFETPGRTIPWHLKQGPFSETDFSALPPTHWTLLVQGVDRVLPEIAMMLDHFDFIPQWRIDDVMISYAVREGSVGPHYDNYDVFLYQAAGQRRWSLTTKQCNEENALSGVDLRIMANFDVEETYVLSPGDVLYLPPHVGHHGISLDDDCMTYSFGYRSYQAQELWDHFGDYLSEQKIPKLFYKDPSWATLQARSAIPSTAVFEAKRVMQQLMEDNALLQDWFGCFATRLDQSAEQQMPMPLEESEWGTVAIFVATLRTKQGIYRDGTCRFAYAHINDIFHLYINGCDWGIEGVSSTLLEQLANHRSLDIKTISLYLESEANQCFLYDLWKLQWLQWLD